MLSAPNAPDADSFLAVEVADFGVALAARPDAVTSESGTVSLPNDLMRDAPDQAVIVLTPGDIAVTFAGETAKRRNRTAKGEAVHASVGFRLARSGDDACASEHEVGPFGVNIADGVVTLTDESLPVPADAVGILRDGRFAICTEVRADFDGSITLGAVSIEFGDNRDGVERVAVCHVPPEGFDDARTIVVGVPAVDAHLAHGDRVGECECVEERDAADVGDGGGDGAGDGDDSASGSADDRGDDRSDADDGGDVDGRNGDHVDADEADANGGDADTGYDEGNDADPGDDIDDGGVVGPVDDAPAGANPDSDGDGILDAGDDCSGAPVGETADSVGCSCSQKDADSDGVDNCDDTCTDTGAGLSVDANGCATNQIDDDSDGVMNDADVYANTAAGATVDVNGCSCDQLDADGDGANDCDDLCAQTPASETVDGDGCSTSQLTAAVTVPGPTDIYLSGQPDGTTATWSLTGWASTAPQHSPVMVDVSAWAGKELRFTATGTVVTGGNNAATPDGRNWVLRPNGLSQVFGLTAMTDYREGALVGVFLTAALPTSGLLPYMSSSGITTTTPLLQHVFVIGSPKQVVIPTGATRLFFGVAERQGLIIDNSGSFDATVEAVAHTSLPSDPLAATRFYVGAPNDPKDGIGWFDTGQWAFDYDFDGVADFTTTFGQAGDTPVVGDWNGDGLDEIGVMMPSALGNSWMLDMNGNGVFDAGDATFTYGADAGSIAIAGDWDGDGTSELGFTTPDNLWHLDFDGSRTDDTSGPMYTQYASGEVLNTQYATAFPVIGDWTGDGVSNLGNMNNGSVGWMFGLDRSDGVPVRVPHR